MLPKTLALIDDDLHRWRETFADNWKQMKPPPPQGHVPVVRIDRQVLAGQRALPTSTVNAALAPIADRILRIAFGADDRA
jgi:hypothetical protein